MILKIVKRALLGTISLWVTMAVCQAWSVSPTASVFAGFLVSTATGHLGEYLVPSIEDQE